MIRSSIKYFQKPIILVIAFLLFSCEITMEKSPKSDHLLWYEQAASEWEEALPLGNGRLGVMVFGNPTKEHIQLNDDSLWPKDIRMGEPRRYL